MALDEYEKSSFKSLVGIRNHAARLLAQTYNTPARTTIRINAEAIPIPIHPQT
jgi:hypothetical protein